MAAGADVEIVGMGKLGEDPAGDMGLLDLAATGIGHVAILRDGRDISTSSNRRGSRSV